MMTDALYQSWTTEIDVSALCQSPDELFSHLLLRPPGFGQSGRRGWARLARKCHINGLHALERSSRLLMPLIAPHYCLCIHRQGIHATELCPLEPTGPAIKEYISANDQHSLFKQIATPKLQGTPA